MGASIKSLPPELWNQICRRLRMKDVCALRLSCSALTLATYHYFADQVFSEFYLTLTSDGLQALRYVAGHEIFSTHVKKLWIVPSLFCADYTWTLDDIKRVVQEQEQLERQLQMFKSRPVHPSTPPRGMTWHPKRPASTENCYTPASSIPIENRYLIYKDAVVDHFQVLLSSPEGRTTRKTRLQDALESCLPSFPNLRAAGLRSHNGHLKDHSTTRFSRKMRGIGSLQRQLGFNPVYPASSPDAAYEGARSSSSRGSLFQSHVFSTLIAALGTTQTQIETLETSGGMMVDDGLPLTPAEEEALTLILQQLQHLSVRISSAHTQDSERQRLREDAEEVAFLLQESVAWEEKKNRPEGEKNRLLPLLAQAAPSIKSLDLTMRLAGMRNSSLCWQKTDLDLADAHFDWISQHFRFSRLSDLSLSNIITTVSSFKKILRTALHTLKHLTLNFLTWTSDPFQGREHKEEGLWICREVCAYLRDHCIIQCLKISSWSYQREIIRVFDPFHDRQESHRLAPSRRAGLYDRRQDAISFTEWIDQLQFVIS